VARSIGSLAGDPGQPNAKAHAVALPSPAGLPPRAETASAATLLLRAATSRLVSVPNWLQFVQFCLVGLSGYVVNLIVFGFCLEMAIHYRGAAVAAFLVAVANNYTWNRLWTFGDNRGHIGRQAFRYLSVSVLGLSANIAVLELFVALGAPPLPAQAVAILLVTPLSFLGNKLWSFRL
jgi:putative flippase GtrA